MKLEQLGWTEDLDQALASVEGAVPVRVVAVHHGACDVLGTAGPGRVLLTHSAPPLSVGDWIAVEPCEPPRLRALLPRRTSLTRQAAGRATTGQVLAANVDRVLVVTAVGGDFSERRLERYLAVAHAGGVEPAVVINKLDLDPAGIGRWLRRAEAVAPGVPVVTTTTAWDGGIDELVGLLAPGRTVVLLGSSGVGKSSIVNVLLGGEVIETAPVRASDETGRHTTTRRELHPLPGDLGLLIDTPGLRELALWDTAGLDETFADITRIATDCQYRDCSHADEPGCAVMEAVQTGELDEARVDSWRTLHREAQAREAMRDPRARKAAGRRMAQMLKEVAEERRRRGR